jgi:hypothetical protein
VALRWIGAVLLVGGIVVGLVVLPWAGLALALAGAGVLAATRSRDEEGGDGGAAGGAGDAGGAGGGAAA